MKSTRYAEPPVVAWPTSRAWTSWTNHVSVPVRRGRNTTAAGGVQARETGDAGARHRGALEARTGQRPAGAVGHRDGRRLVADDRLGVSVGRLLLGGGTGSPAGGGSRRPRTSPRGPADRAPRAARSTRRTASARGAVGRRARERSRRRWARPSCSPARRVRPRGSP